jgi:hypothetical protein
MEKFKTAYDMRDLPAIERLLKSSSLDTLKTIAKRFKIAVSTMKKQLILQRILDAVRNNASLQPEPQLFQMTKPQLKTTALQLGIDVAPLTTKKALTDAIIMATGASVSMATGASVGIDQTGGVEETKDSTPTPNIETRRKELRAKTVPFLKSLAKQYGAKISKLSKDQLITHILSYEASGKPTITTPSTTTLPLKKMLKNDLIVKATSLGLDTKGMKKEDIIALLKNVSTTPSDYSEGPSLPPTLTSTPVLPSVTVTSLPITAEEEKMMLKDRKVTVTRVKSILASFGVIVPKTITKRADVIHLLRTPSPLPPTTIAIPPPPPHTAPPKHVSPSMDIDIVSLEDIQTPFTPYPLGSLLDEPSEQDLKNELLRCLQFYDHPTSSTKP